MLSFSSRLKNIEETEKAKRQVAEERRIGKSRSDVVLSKDEEHLVATRCRFSLLSLSLLVD